MSAERPTPHRRHACEVALAALLSRHDPRTWSAPDTPTDVVALARRLRVLGPLRERLQGAGPCAPAWVRLARLATEAALLAERARQFALRPALSALAVAWAGHGVRAMAWKGLMLAETVYARPEERPYDDVDVLVDANEIPAAEAVLRDQGYEPQGPPPGPAPVEHGWRRSGPGRVDLWIDLHWELVGRRSPLGGVRVPAVQLLSRAVPGTHGLLFPTPEDALLLAAANLAGHGFAPLGLYLDVAELWSQPLDVETTWQRARDAGLSRVLAAASRVAQRWFPRPGTARALAGPARSPNPALLLRLLAPRVLMRPGASHEPPRRYLAKLLAPDRGWASLAMLARRWRRRSAAETATTAPA